MPLPRKSLIPGILIFLMIAALAAPPAWWSAGNPPVITGAAANNRGPANIGQAKHMAKSALDALRPILPAVVTQIENDLASIVDLTVPDTKTPVWIEKQKAPLLIGQLKAISAPFYARLHAASPAWLAAERTANGTNHPNSIFPWTAETTDDQNKAIATIGQLKAVFSLRFETLPQGPADTDNDGLPDFWEMQYFGNLNQTANGDPDEDDINNAQENQLGLDPTHLDKIGPVNLGFDEEITDFPDMSFRDEYPSDLYDQSSIPGYYTDGNENTEGWQADTGSHIEIWNEGVSSSSVPPPPTPSSPYVELQSHLGGHGVKQVFNMLPGTRLNFILRYKGRYEYDPYDNAFDLKVEGASELLVDGTPAAVMENTRKHSFMEEDEWDKYVEWQYATVSITAESGGSGLTKITLSFVPETTTRLGADGEEEITYGGFVDILPVEVEQQDQSPSMGIRFCRWFDAYQGLAHVFDDEFADEDRDRFRIKIPAIIPNLTKIKIKSTDLNGAVVNGAVIAKTTDGDYEVGMKQENGAMVSEWLLLVSDGDDDVNYNGKGTDDGRDDQTLLADFQSGIVVTFPELGGGEVKFSAQKALGVVTLDAWYLSPAGDVPQVIEQAIGRHIVKMQEIYRQIGIRVAWASIGGLQVDQAWFDAVPASNEEANHLNQYECSSAMNTIKRQSIPPKHIRIGYVNATLKPDSLDFQLSRGFTIGNSNGSIISLTTADGSRGILGVSAHEVGHVLNLEHPESPLDHWLMKGNGMPWSNNKLDPKRFQDGDFVIIRNIYQYYVPN